MMREKLIEGLIDWLGEQWQRRGLTASREIIRRSLEQKDDLFLADLAARKIADWRVPELYDAPICR